MTTSVYFNAPIETMKRQDLDSLVDERIRYTVRYAAKHSPYYRRWFSSNKITPESITGHEALLELPVISGATIRSEQPPHRQDFSFKSASWEDIFTIHETTGTSGTPKTFFLTWDDWQRYAEKYARAFRAQGLAAGDRVIICTSFGLSVGGTTMTLAAHRLKLTLVPTGRCDFPVRMIRFYRPTSIVGSVFKLLHLARRMETEGLQPAEAGLQRLIVGGESFAEEARSYLSERWGCPVFNTYGSTEGTMSGECPELSGLHVPEDLVHLDIYDPNVKEFIPDGKSGRAVLTTLLADGESCGTLLLNYDTEDVTAVRSRTKCKCGRTHMRIENPKREAETVWVHEAQFNRVDVERGVFQRENMEYLTGDYEAFVYDGADDDGGTLLSVTLECRDPDKCDRGSVENHFLSGFFRERKQISKLWQDGLFRIRFTYRKPGELEFQQTRGRPTRLVDRR